VCCIPLLLFSLIILMTFDETNSLRSACVVS
jgi:hypothetical protein